MSELCFVNLPEKSEISEWIKPENVRFFGNDILYDMCEKKSPTHNNPEEIHSKLWLIGRAYAAALERSSKKPKGTETVKIYEDTSIEISRYGQDLDRMLAALNPVKDEQSMKCALDVHKMLVDTFKSITGQLQSSLSSKYLHFHKKDVFFIVDNRAWVAINWCVKGRVSKLSDCDDYYSKFCIKALAFINEICKIHGTELNPRELDTILLKIYKKVSEPHAT